MLLVFWYQWAMPLSAEEIATAKKAYYEMRNYEDGRTIYRMFSCFWLFVILLFGVLLACGMPVSDGQGKWLRGWDAVPSLLSVAFRDCWWVFIILALQAITYRRDRSRYTENLKVVTELEQKHSGELPCGLEQEVQGENAKNRRAMLWRMDAFLSRKPISR
jgi:hypothetical protein